MQIDESSDIVSDTILAGDAEIKKTGSFQEMMSLNKNDLKS